MAIKAITKYAAEDGTEFFTQVDARNYDVATSSMKEVAEALGAAGLSSFNIGNVPKELVLNVKKATALRDALNRSIRRHNESKVRKATAKAAA